MKIRTIILIGVFVLIFSLLSFFLFKLYIIKYPSIDVLQNTFFSEEMINSGNLGFDNIYNTYGPKIFGLRATFVSDTGVNYPATQIGYIFFLSIFWLIGNNLIFISTFILLGLLTIFSYKLSKMIFNKKVAFIFIILLICFSSIIYWSTLFINDISALTFFVISLFYFFRFKKEGSNKFMILFILFFFFSGFLRYSYFLFSFPLIFSFLYNNKKKDFLKIILLIVLFICFIFSLLYFHFHYYQSIFGPVGDSSNLILLSPNIQKSIQLPVHSLSDKISNFFNFEFFVNNFKLYLLDSYLLISILAFLSIFPILIKKSKIQIDFLILAIGIILIEILLYMGKEWSGYASRFLMVSGYTRYLIPLYFIILLFSANSINYYKKFFNKRFKLIVLFLFLTSFFIFNLSVSFMQIDANLKVGSETSNIDRIIDQTPENSVIFANYYDKYIFPKRMTAVYSTFDKEIRIEETFNTIEMLISKNHQIYFINEDNLKDYDNFKLKEDYFPYFEDHGLRIEEVNNFIYKITKNETIN